MTEISPKNRRVLLRISSDAEAEQAMGLLRDGGIAVERCEDLPTMCARVREGCAALLLSEDVLDDGAVAELQDILVLQPPWSDLPIIVLTSEDDAKLVHPAQLDIFGENGNLTMLTRPLRPATLVTTILAALRTRQRQHEMQGLIRQVKAGEERLQGILDRINDAFIAIDADWRITYVNSAYLKLVSPLFQSAGELIGYNLWERFPDIEQTEGGRFYKEAMAEQTSGTQEVYYERLGLWLEVRVFPSRTGISLYVQNISERKKAEGERVKLYNEVCAAADHLKLALAAADLGDWSWDLNSDMMTMSPRAAEIFGIPAGAYMTRSVMRELLHPDDRAAARASATRAVDEGIAYESEYRVIRPDGRMCWVAARGAGLTDEQGNVIGSLGVVQDITARKTQEEEVKSLSRKVEEQANLFDATLSNIADLVYSFDREGRVTYANRALLEVWGRSLPEVIGKNVFELGYPEDLAQKVQGQLRQVVASGQAVRDETVYLSAAGEEDLHDYIYNPVFDANGQVTAVVGTTRLVTGRRQAERAARQLAAIVQSSDDAIISKDLNGMITTWNQGAERLFGYRAEEVIGKAIIILIPEERRDEEPEIMRRIRKGEPIQHYETERRRKDGSSIFVSLSVSPIRDAEGKVVGASKIARDITEQKRIERALKEAKEAAETANRSKDHFLAVLSHELRTPLTPVLMTASALEMDPTVPAHLRADMALIRRNVELETKLIDDLLDLSRITSGKLALHVKPVDLNEAVRQVCEICRPQISEKKIQLAVDLGADAGTVQADPARLQQVCWNILKNAAKFTPDGGSIQVTTSRVSEEMVRVTVRDSGIGIEASFLPKVFEAFEQESTKITRQFGGLGLGLAITKALVVLHEGNIRVRSEGTGKGTTFIVDWPSSRIEKRAEGSSPEKSRSSDSLRILVVEDHPDTAAMLARLLGATGYTVTVANSAGAALEMASHGTFDLVLSDIGLPDSTGYELMKQLRERQQIKGIAMSGYGMEEDIRRSLEAGFSEHLVKPVNLSALEQTIRKLTAIGA